MNASFSLCRSRQRLAFSALCTALLALPAAAQTGTGSTLDSSGGTGPGQISPGAGAGNRTPSTPAGPDATSNGNHTPSDTAGHAQHSPANSSSSGTSSSGTHAHHAKSKTSKTGHTKSNQKDKKAHSDQTGASTDSPSTTSR